MAWQAELDQRCGGCGQPWDESTSPDNELGYVAPAIRCHACKAQAVAMREWTSDGGDPHGVFFGVRRRAPHPHD